MKLPLLLAAIAVVATGCSNAPQPHNSRSSAVPTVQGDRAISQQPAKNYHILANRPGFEIGGQKIDTIQGFKAFIASLPPGSTITWEECVGFKNIPLTGPVMTTQDCTNYCKEHGVEFHYTSWGY